MTAGGGVVVAVAVAVVAVVVVVVMVVDPMTTTSWDITQDFGSPLILPRLGVTLLLRITRLPFLSRHRRILTTHVMVCGWRWRSSFGGSDGGGDSGERGGG